VRRYIAAALIAVLLVGSGGCSQPVDPGSPVPAQSQPIVTLLALIGLAIGVAAFVHHGSASAGPTPTPSPTPGGLTGPSLVVVLTKPGSDMNIASTTTGIVLGVIEPATGGTRYEQVSGNVKTGLSLPGGYAPTAVAMDSSGNAWLDDNSGNVKVCAAPTTSNGSCSPSLSFNDGLGVAGTRSMDIDSTDACIAIDTGSNVAKFALFALPNGTPNGTGSFPGTARLLPADAVTATDFLGANSFTLFRADGSSFVISGNPPANNTFDLNPLPNATPGNVAVSQNASFNETFYGLLGFPTGASYQIARYIGANSTGATPGSEQASIAIAQNGTTLGNSFAVPLRSLRADLSATTYALDGSGNLVEFASF